MKRLVLLALAASLMASCYGLKDETFKTLEPITIGETSSVINVSLGEKLIYDKLVVSSKLPVEYQWAYGKRKSSSEYDMESMEVISSDPQVNYVFPKLGQYVLRLRLDNGEDIQYKYFTLNVNSGLDEGLLVLTDDALTFIKRRNDDEIASGAREIWQDIFSTMNPDEKISGGTSLFLSSYSNGGISYNHLSISTSDSRGSIYDLDPKTMTLVSTIPMKEETGTWCCDFSGKQTAATGSYTFLRAADGRVFRYDLFTPFLTERTDVSRPVSRSKNIMYTSTSSTYVKSVFYTESFLCQPATSGTTTTIEIPSSFRLVNLASDRDANKTYLLLRSVTSMSDYSIVSTTGSLAALKDVANFSADNLNMDEESRFCASLHSNDVYYSYADKVYRWSLISQPSSTPALTLPAGEQICDLATNFMGDSDDTTAETLLYVATWNPSRDGLGGSVYVFDIATDTLLTSYEGICDKPVKLLYKYRVY